MIRKTQLLAQDWLDRKLFQADESFPGLFLFCFFIFVFVLDSWLELIAQHQILRCCIVHFHLPHWPHLNFNSNDKTARFDSQFIKQCQYCCYLQFQALIEFVCKLDVVVTSCVTITSCLTWNIKLNNYVLYLERNSWLNRTLNQRNIHTIISVVNLNCHRIIFVVGCNCDQSCHHHLSFEMKY